MVPNKKANISAGTNTALSEALATDAAIHTIPQGRNPLMSPKKKNLLYPEVRPAKDENLSKTALHDLGKNNSTNKYIKDPITKLMPIIIVTLLENF